MTTAATSRTLAALLAVCACVTCQRAEQSGRPATSGVDSRPIIRYADLVNVDVRNVPLLMAFDDLALKGYTVTTTHATGATMPASLLVRGDVDVAMVNNQTAWTAILKGADIRTIAQYTTSTSVLAARAPIRSCGDLHRRPFGASSSAGLSPTLFAAYLTRRCPGTEPVTIVIPQADGRAAALLAGHIDAAMMPGEQLIRLQRQSDSRFHALMSYAQEFPRVQIDGLHVNRRWAAAHPEAVKDLLRAQLLAHRRIRANPQLLYEEAQKRLNIDAATARAIGASHLAMNIWDVNGGLTPESVKATVDFLMAAGVLPAGVSPDQLVDLSFLNAVLRDLGRLPDAETTEERGASQP